MSNSSHKNDHFGSVSKGKGAPLFGADTNDLTLKSSLMNGSFVCASSGNCSSKNSNSRHINSSAYKLQTNLKEPYSQKKIEN